MGLTTLNALLEAAIVAVHVPNDIIKLPSILNVARTHKSAVVILFLKTLYQIPLVYPAPDRKFDYQS